MRTLPVVIPMSERLAVTVRGVATGLLSSHHTRTRRPYSAVSPVPEGLTRTNLEQRIKTVENPQKYAERGLDPVLHAL
jgi:hypothetical protein